MIRFLFSILGRFRSEPRIDRTSADLGAVDIAALVAECEYYKNASYLLAYLHGAAPPKAPGEPESRPDAPIAPMNAPQVRGNN